jgi:hypothetical protein
MWGFALISCELTQDPGRFICNYLYYESLRRCDQSSSTTSDTHAHADAADVIPEHALFVHVPPTEVCYDLSFVSFFMASYANTFMGV